MSMTVTFSSLRTQWVVNNGHKIFRNMRYWILDWHCQISELGMGEWAVGGQGPPVTSLKGPSITSLGAGYRY